MVGAFATGKTSLVARFVKGIYSDKYQTTIGVKIDKKQMRVHGEDLTLVLWDLHGEDEFQNVRMSYLRGAAAYLLVVDGTRRASLDVALELKEKVTGSIGDLPFLMLINKADLQAEWEITEADIAYLKAQNLDIICTSAKTEFGVEKAFALLAQKIVLPNQVSGESAC